jgi:hypothetical protein
MKINFISNTLLLSSMLVFASCTKDSISDLPEPVSPDRDQSTTVKAEELTYTTYFIPAGSHYCTTSTLKSVKTSEMRFAVKFDSSAIYKTVDPLNQSDINKLYGFSEGLNNQYNSARFGWSWYNNRLNIFAYVYKRGVRAQKRITSVAIGREHTFSIKVSGASYIFTINGISATMARGLSTATASGYQQYPYFGGDEVAPHNVTILIRNLN